MATKPEHKTVDCLEIKHLAQEKIQAEIAGLTPEQEIAYFHEKAEAGTLGDWWRSVREAQSSKARASDRAA